MAVVAYMRVIEGSSLIKVYLLVAKTQVAPLRAMTILRLELQACCMALKLAQFIVKQLDLAFMKISFWTDSSVALA